MVRINKKKAFSLSAGLGLFIIFSISSSVSHAAFPTNAIQEKTLILTVMVNDAADVRGEEIVLGDIAFIKCSDTGLKTQLEKLVLGDSPKPGCEKRLSGRWVQSMIRSELGPGMSVHLEHPDIIIVKRAFQKIPEAQYFRAFNSYFQNEHPDEDVKVRHFNVRGLNLFPKGNVELKVIPDNRRDMGMATLSVIVKIDGKQYGTVVLSGQVDVYKKVVCVNTYVKRGDVLTENDLGLDVINISKAPVDTITDSKNAVGKYVKTNVREGDFLRESMLGVPPLIEKGDKVKLVARKGSLTVIAMGIAKTDGPEGAQVRVKNIASGKVVVGRVKDASTVDVLF